MPTYTRHKLNGPGASGIGQFRIDTVVGIFTPTIANPGFVIHTCPDDVVDVVYIQKQKGSAGNTYPWVSGEFVNTPEDGPFYGAATADVPKEMWPNGLTMTPGDILYIFNGNGTANNFNNFSGHVNRITGQ